MNRKCGSCTLCCTLLPVHDVLLEKPGVTRCKHQCAKGCRVYDTVAMPMSCSVWNCRWLVDEQTHELRRPDRTHYVIDVMPDFITATNSETGEAFRNEVLVIWIDPAHPKAHEDPALRRYVDSLGLPMLVRFNERDALVIVPPSLCKEREWLELDAGCVSDTPTTINEKAAVFGGHLEGDIDPSGMSRTVLALPDGRRIPVATKLRIEG